MNAQNWQLPLKGRPFLFLRPSITATRLCNLAIRASSTRPYKTSQPLRLPMESIHQLVQTQDDHGCTTAKDRPATCAATPTTVHDLRQLDPRNYRHRICPSTSAWEWSSCSTMVREGWWIQICRRPSSRNHTMSAAVPTRSMPQTLLHISRCRGILNPPAH